jgi:hypothetical protein
MDTNNHKSVALDIETYEIIKRIADLECRSISMQIKWLIRQLPRFQNVRDVAGEPIRPAKKVKGYMRGNNTQVATVLLRFAETGATLRAADFNDLDRKTFTGDPVKILSSLEKRGDLKKIGNVRPFYYQITPNGMAKCQQILDKREAI